tara:strand:- start:201 stop:590 length:390 start_codon:yes stop_codon:yes gene_type:complete
MNKKKNITLGNLKPTREFNYVDDVCESYFKVMKNKKINGEVINIGSNTNISILNLVKKIQTIIGTKNKILQKKEIKRPNLSEVDNLRCNNNKLKNLCKWTPKINLKSGLDKTIKWYASNLKYYANKYRI